MSGVQPHIYGKSITKPFRKMGHITISGDHVEEVISLAKKVLTEIQVISK
jgi:5-(carboxyamino)imidazole ribonucleotide synthase